MAPKSKIKITQLKIKILDQGNQRLRCPYHVYKKTKISITCTRNQTKQNQKKNIN